MSTKKAPPRTVLMAGPFPEPITGNALANEIVQKALLEEGHKVRTINTSLKNFGEDVGHFTFSKLWHNVKLAVQAHKIIGVDVVYITPGQTFFGVLKYGIFLITASLLNKRIVLHIHGNHLGVMYTSLSGLKKRIVHTLLSKATQGIVLSDSLKGNLTPFMTSEHIASLPNFAQPYLVDTTRPVHHSSLRIVYLSNLMTEKGIFDLLDALLLLEEQGVQYEAKIAGGIDHTIQNQINTKLEGLKNTTCVGIVSGEAKKELLQWSSIFVLPTYYTMEGQPIAILEAMATKNVIITTPHAGIPDIITDGEHGFFVKPKNPKSIANQLVELSKTPDTIQKIATRNEIYFSENFTLEIFKDRLFTILFNPKKSVS